MNRNISGTTCCCSQATVLASRSSGMLYVVVRYAANSSTERCGGIEVAVVRLANRIRQFSCPVQRLYIRGRTDPLTRALAAATPLDSSWP
jgi:hypothetical protein